MDCFVANERLMLRGDRTAYWESQRTLLVADLHWGKCGTFRRAGIPLPEGNLTDDLAVLGTALLETGAERLLILGDLLHAKAGRTIEVFAEVSAWRDKFRQLSICLVRGNHDRSAGDPPADWQMQCVMEPYRDGPFSFRHHPEETADSYTLAGHIHPGVLLSGKGRQRLRLPCFHFGQRLGILPAFGSLTGLAGIQPAAGDQVFVLADGVVIRIETDI